MKFTPLVTRRRFIAFTAGASALAAGSMAAAAMPAPASQCFLADDSELLQLEQTITEQRRLAQAYDPEVYRLSEIWEAELDRLDWEAVKQLPASLEHRRLTTLQQPYWERHDAAVERMFAIPASTAEGRAAKASVILGLMAEYMMSDEDEGDWPLDLVRKLLIELGGKPSVSVRPWES